MEIRVFPKCLIHNISNSKNGNTNAASEKEKQKKSDSRMKPDLHL